MIKKLLFCGLLASFSIGASAESYQFSYCSPEGVLGATGFALEETLDIAMLLDNPTYAGLKVKKIDAYVNADKNTVNNLSNTKVWVSTVFSSGAPDGPSESATLQMTEYAGEEVGVLSASLSEPYVLDGTPIFIGYTITVDKVAGTAEEYPILIDKSVVDANAFYLHTSKSVPTWNNDYYEMGAPLIVVTLEGDGSEEAIVLSGYQKSIYGELNKDFYCQFAIQNTGLSPINNITYEYTLDGGDAITRTYDFPSPILPSLGSQNVDIPFNPIDKTGKYSVEMKINALNGNVYSGDITAKFDVEIVAFYPTHRPLVEEFTGLWCGYCPRGFVAMELLGEKYGDEAVIVCYHNNNTQFPNLPDPMAVTNSYPVAVSGFPSASIDRGKVIDPYYGSSQSTDMYIETDFQEAAALFTEAEIDVTAVVEGTDVVATSSVRFAKDVDDADYVIGYVLSCNGMYSNTWGQSNYFTGQTSLRGTPLEEFIRKGAVVYGLTFNDVAIDVKAMTGIRNSLPSTIESLETYTNVYTFDISDVTNVLKQSINEYIKVPNLVVNAFVLNRKTGRIVNANKFAFAGSDAVESLTAEGAETVATEYYDLTGRKILNPSNGIFVKTERLSDGSHRSSKIVVK